MTVSTRAASRFLRFVIALVVMALPSLILWWRFADLLPFYPILHAELLVAAMILAIWPRAGLLPAFAAIVFVVANAVATLFHFSSVIEMVSQPLGDQLGLLALVHEYVAFLILGLGIFLLMAVSTRWSRRSDAVIPLLLLLLTASLDGAAERLSRPLAEFGHVNLLGSPSGRLVRDRLLHPAEPMRRVRDQPALSEQVLQWQSRNPGRSVVFVVAESFGAPVDPQVRAWLDQQIAPPPGYTLRSGDTTFMGTTTYGELRQLCQLRGSYSALDEAMASECLPSQLTVQGLRTVGLHGFSAYMFSRRGWWRDIGLQQGLFLEDLSSEYPNRCGGPFKGLCDVDLIDAAVRQLDGSPAFVYVLTLNTHLPLPDIDPRLLPSALCMQRNMTAETCKMVGMQGQLLRTLRERVLARPDRPLLVVVGDHAAPFVQAANRAAFKPTSVPYWIVLTGS
jgi:hypothetical protein